MVGISRPVVKHSFLVKQTEDIPQVLKKAFWLAASGRSMSVIIEAAVMNMRLRDVGIDSSKEFVERILKNIDHNKQEQ